MKLVNSIEGVVTFNYPAIYKMIKQTMKKEVCVIIYK